MNPENIIQQDSGGMSGTLNFPENYVLISQDTSQCSSEDSTIFKFPVSNETITIYPSGSPLFISHELKPHNIRPQIYESTNNDWIFLLLAVCFILLAWIQVFFRKRFFQVLQSLYSEKRVNFLIRDGNLFKEQIALGLGFVYISSCSLILLLIGKVIFKVSLGNDLMTFLKIFLALILFILFKYILIRVLRTVFQTAEATSRYLLNSLIFSLNLGVIILPFLVMIIYTGFIILIYSVLILMAIIFIFKLFRGLYVGIVYSKFSIFYLFLYLCTVEILPVIIVVKLLIG